MNIRYDPSLIEEIVLLEVKRREEEGDLRLFQEYHALADSLYERLSLDRREAAFEKLNRKLFLKWGFGEVVVKAWEEFPRLAESIEEVFVGKAITWREEGSDLSGDRKSLGIKVFPRRFLSPQGLQGFLRHELQHIADMLDPAFGYACEERLANSPAEENLIRDRYRTIWAVSIDGRLTRGGKETVATREERWRAFEALYSRIPEAQRVAVFEALWGSERLTHSEILAMAKDHRALLRWAGEAAVEPRISNLKFPGSPCPLCGFPTYAWVEAFGEQVARFIQQDFPWWEPEEGACERCGEAYALGLMLA